jgi:antitoxin component YwqK of YwqJK toxin-antitoxin module
MAPYINGEIHGILMTYWPSGRPKSRIHFVHGMRGGARGEMFWDQKGKKIRG